MNSCLDESCEPMEVDLSNSFNTSSLDHEVSISEKVGKQITRLSPIPKIEPAEEDIDCHDRRSKRGARTLFVRLGKYNVARNRSFSDHPDDNKSQMKARKWARRPNKSHINQSGNNLSTLDLDNNFPIIRVKEPIQIKNALLAVIFIIWAVLFYSYYGISCTGLDVRTIEHSLSKSLYGQERAIKKIVGALESNDQVKILFFYGGTGVGKSYASSLMFSEHWNSTNVYHFTMPGFRKTFPNTILHGLYVCDSSFIVIDDLTIEDSDVVNNINEIITKIENMNKKITLLLIYNCNTKTDKTFSSKFFTCDNSFFSKLKRDYEPVQGYKEFIEFETLSEDHLRKCVQDVDGQMAHGNKFEEVRKYFDVTTDGCKGVKAKIQFLKSKLFNR